MEIIDSLKYYFDASRGKPGTRATQHHPDLGGRTGKGMGGPGGKMDFGTAFGVYQPRAETDRQLEASRGGDSSYDEAIRLAPYGYQEGSNSPEPSVGA